MKILHAIHDFLPGHRAGSEIYAFELCRELSTRGHGVRVLCAEYDETREHGSLLQRSHEGVPVSELVNNWAFASFEESYQSPKVNGALETVLDEMDPDVVHVHNLLNLSLDLPALARERGIPSVATLHDFTLVCPSGGQRVHLAEEHVCIDIDRDRCRRCFPDTHFYKQMQRNRHLAEPAAPGLAGRLRSGLAGLFGGNSNAGAATPIPVSARDIERRLAKVRRVYEAIDLFVAPSVALGQDFRRLGMPAERIRVSDYGFVPLERRDRPPSAGKLRIGFVGTVIWHKGVHVLVEAARHLPPERYELLVFGDPTLIPDYGASLEQEARGLPIRFMGTFEGDAAADIYSRIDVLVVPSLWPENSPLVIHEAFMAGVPVVGSNLGGTPGLVTHERNGLIYEAYSAGELAAALQSLIDDPERLRRFAEALPEVKRIQEDVREWEAVYHEVLERGERGNAV
ncbi:MAG: glycosyltransferase family 4 protein [Planctomycetota bacterium]